MKMTIDGMPIEIEEKGSGEPLVLVHGALADGRIWRPHAERLASSFRVLAPTLWGFGPEDRAVKLAAFGTAAHASQLVAMVESFDRKPVALAAWSYAGHAALAAALWRPDLFSRVLVYEPGVASYVEDETRRRACEENAAAVFGPIFTAFRQSGPETAARVLIDQTGGEGCFARQPAALQQIELENAHTMTGLLHQAPAPHIAAKDLAAATVPISVCWGAKTLPMFSIVSESAAAAIGRGDHRSIAGAAHMWPLEDPAGFCELLRSWPDRQ
jgi:pimeloyl-ACP methyl ester carboxylesterase